MEAAAVKHAHGKEQEERRQRQIIEERDEIKDAVGEILEAVEKRERFDHVTQKIGLGQEVAKKGDGAEARKDGNRHDRRGELALGEGGDEKGLDV